MQNIETVTVEKSMCQVDSQDVDGCPLRNPENREQRTFGTVREGGNDFLAIIVTGNKTWMHHSEPGTKRQSMDWHHANSLCSPDLAPCDYNLFSKLKKFLHGMRF